MKTLKLRTLLFLKIIFLLFFVAFRCTTAFEDHYNPKRMIDSNIIQVLENNDKFSDFIKIIDKLELRVTLGESALYTCLAPTNDHVQSFLQQSGYNSIDDIPEIELRQYVNYHFINGMYYKYDIRKQYDDALLRGGVNPTRAIIFKTRNEYRLPGKPLRIFTPSFFENQQDDYLSLYHKNGGGFMVENVMISEEESDIEASNGVIHVLDTPLKILPRSDEAIMNDEETSIYSEWIEKHETFTLGEIDPEGFVDTTKYKSYTLRRNFADETLLSTLFVPTNKAIETYFEPYLPDLYNTLDSVPKFLMTQIINGGILNELWFKSDIARNNPEVNTGTFIQRTIDLASHITGSILASNSIIYKMDKMIEPPKLNSVEGGIYMKYSKYSQWNWMFLNTTLEAGLTDGQYSQHAPATLLVQPDDVWGSPPAAALGTLELEERLKECRTSILNYNVLEDGGFQKRYYPTENGYLLYDDEKIYDYTGKSVSLIKDEPTWERINGGIFEIDGFLTPLEKNDTSRTIYRLIETNPELSLFRNACNDVGVGSELNLTGFFTYTVFAPTNSAILNSGVDIQGMEESELLQWVQSYVVVNRYIFTDGVFNGSINNKNRESLVIEGAWDSFYVKSPFGNTIVPETSNIQGSNGVLHLIGEVF